MADTVTLTSEQFTELLLAARTPSLAPPPKRSETDLLREIACEILQVLGRYSWNYDVEQYPTYCRYVDSLRNEAKKHI